MNAYFFWRGGANGIQLEMKEQTFNLINSFHVKSEECSKNIKCTFRRFLLLFKFSFSANFLLASALRIQAGNFREVEIENCDKM